ncbi:MAG: TonB-dependent receptor [Sphingomonadaceae bacterium]|nr:TonB-dependent receptor [Sphingomonadaceae bacterium]
MTTYRKILLTSVAWAGFSAPAAAQQAADDNMPTTGVEEIIVTAQRREQSIQDAPVAVSALTAESLDRLGIESTTDIDRAVPNLYVLEATANPSTLSVAMRGSAEQAGGLAVSEASVGVYVDDVYRGRPTGTNLEFSDVERIEVLRGPQGTLYGRNTIAGAIKIISRKPRDEFYANGSVAYGSRDYMTVKGAVGGPIGGGWGASIAGLYREEDGFQFNIARDERVGDVASAAGRAILNYYGDERLSATFILSGASDRNDGYNSVPATYAARQTTTDGVSFAEGRYNITRTPAVNRGATDQWSATLDLGYDLDSVKLRSITGYIDIDDVFRTDFTGGVRTPTGFAIGFFRDSVGRYKQLSQEFQVSGESGRLDWILGAYYFRERNRQVLNDLLGATRLLPTDFRLKTESIAVFGQGTFSFTDSLSLTAGLRWSQDKKELDASIQNGFAFPFAAATINRRDTFRSLSPKVGIDWKPNDRTLVYLSAARGFKAGGYNGLAIANPRVVQSPYDEMNVWSYEGGLKIETPDRSLVFNAAAFLAKYDAIQQTALIDQATFSFAVQNVGKATVYGIELEAQAVPAPGLTLFAQLGLAHDKYDELLPGSTAAINNAKRLPVTPRTSGQVGFTFDAPVSSGVDLKLGSDLSYEGSYFAAVDNTLRIDSYWRWNAFVGLGFGERFEARLSGRNLADDKTVVCCSTQSSAVTVLPPRTWMLELRYKY